MSKPHRLVRLALWILAPLTFGIAVGLGTSKSLWNYWWVPPTVHVDYAARPTEIAFFWVWPSLEVKPLADRNELLSDELRRCLGGHQEECTSGRALFQTRNVELTTLPTITAIRVRGALDSARRLSRTAFLRVEQQGTGFVTIYDLHGEQLTLITFNTAELHDDTRGHAEILLGGSGERTSLVDFVSYYFDVAGIEFATPRVLVLIGILLAFLVTALIAAVGFIARRVRMKKRSILKGD